MWTQRVKIKVCDETDADQQFDYTTDGRLVSSRVTHSTVTVQYRTVHLAKSQPKM